jgi:hypothetical protein
MTFDECLRRLHPKLRKGGDVRMTQGQFAHMLKQFYDAGHRHARNEVHQAIDLTDVEAAELWREADRVFKEADKAFEEAEKAQGGIWARVARMLKRRKAS